MAKKAFAWDHEEVLGIVNESEKVQHDVKICTLNGKQFVVATKKVMSSEGWKIVKNQTFERTTFNLIAQLVDKLA